MGKRSKRLASTLSVLLFFAGCIDQSKVVVDIKRKIPVVNKATTDHSFITSVSSVQVINNQLVITGSGLSNVTSVKMNGSSFAENFVIESQSAGQIIANSVRHFSFDVSKILNLVLADASASATYAIDFSLCNASLNGKGFNCAIPANDKDVLSFDAVSNKWKPRAINGLTYQGTWDAHDPEPAGASAGDYYIVGVASSPYAVGDWIVWNGSAYDRISNSTTITSVFGRTGAVVATKGDYDLNKLTDIDLTVPPTIGKVLKFDGAKWVAGDDLSGGGAGSVTTAEIAAGAVTDAKIDTVSASKITGTITSTQIADGTIVNADVAATAAIDYSKLNIPSGSIPYAKLNIADGDIPAAKITGLPSATSVLSTTITDGDSTHAPDGNAVHDALAGKMNLTGGTLTVGTISGVPTPTNSDDAANKGYVDSSVSGKVNRSGDTMSGDLNIDTQLKLKGTSNYVTVKADSSSSAWTMTLPASGGTNGYVLSTNGSGVLSWINPASTTSGSGTVNSAAIIDGSIVDADISATAAIAQTKISGLATSLAAKEDAVTAGTTAQFYRGDKTWQALDTSMVSENGNLYFTNARVLGLALTSLNTGTSGAITATDTVLGAFGKLQYQVTDLKAAGQWTKTGNDISYSAGNVSVDTKLLLKDSGSNYVELRAPATVTTTYTLTFPATAGSSNQVLQTNGSGVLSWANLTDTSVQTFAKTTLPTCATGEVLKSNGSTLTCVTDNTGAGAFSGTVSRAVATDSSGALTTSTVTSAELAYVSGVTSAVQTQLNAKEATITAGTSLQYYRGDKTFVTLDTNVVPENSNLYFTTSRARAASVVDAIVDAITDIAPSQNAVHDALSGKLNTTGGTLSVGTISGVPTPTNADDVVNKAYVDGFGQWAKLSGNLYFNSGFVGIGTSGPQAALHVSQNAPTGYSVILNENTGTGGGAWSWLVSAPGSPLATNGMCFARGGACRMTLSDSELGAQNAVFGGDVKINNTFTVTSSLGNHSRIHALGNTYGNAAALTMSSDRNYDGQLVFIKGVADWDGDEGGPHETFSILNNGDSRFGNITFNNEYNVLMFPDPGGAHAGMFGGITGDDGGYKKITLFHKNAIAFETDTTSRDITKTRLYITQGGNVGIATTNPTEALDVNGNVKGTTFLYTSDRRLKNNIDPIDNALAKILRLRGVEFNWKKDGKREVGLIAQEVEAVEPLLVTTAAEGGYKSVKYGNIVALLIEAIKAENKELDHNRQMMLTMQSQIDINTREIASLKAENRMLKSYLCRKDPEAPFCDKK